VTSRAQRDRKQDRSPADARTDVASTTSSVLSQLATGPVKVRKLRIEPGF